MQCVRSRAAGAVRPKSGRFVTSSIAIGLTYNADPAVQAGIKCVKHSLVFWHVAGEFVRTRVRRAWTSLQQLCDGSSRWMKVRGFGSHSTARNGSRLVVKVSTGPWRVWVTLLN